MNLTNVIANLVKHDRLSEAEAFMVMTEIMNGQATDVQIAGLITALGLRGETEDEITGFAKAIREHAFKAAYQNVNLVDTCGTGGDQSKTFNISTTVAFVVAACGVPVAKHGNRSVSSQCGSADLLEALGVDIGLSPDQSANAIAETGIGFLFAPVFHLALKHAAKARKELGIRTVFNLLGPLANPLQASYQLMGVYDPDLTEKIAKVMLRLGVKAGLVVHGCGGMDEISTLGPSKVTELCKGTIVTHEIRPEVYGIARAKLSDLVGGSQRENAEITLSILKGEKGPRHDIVVVNAAAALYIAAKAGSIDRGIRLAREALLSGKALNKLESLISYSQRANRKGGVVGSLSMPT